MAKHVIKWRAATPDDIGLLARFSNELGSDWSYGMIADYEPLEHVFVCAVDDKDDWQDWKHCYLFCQVQEVSNEVDGD